MKLENKPPSGSISHSSGLHLRLIPGKAYAGVVLRHVRGEMIIQLSGGNLSISQENRIPPDTRVLVVMDKSGRFSVTIPGPEQPPGGEQRHDTPKKDAGVKKVSDLVDVDLKRPGPRRNTAATGTADGEKSASVPRDYASLQLTKGERESFIGRIVSLGHGELPKGTQSGRVHQQGAVHHYLVETFGKELEVSSRTPLKTGEIVHFKLEKSGETLFMRVLNEEKSIPSGLQRILVQAGTEYHPAYRLAYDSIAPLSREPYFPIAVREFGTLILDSGLLYSSGNIRRQPESVDWPADKIHKTVTHDGKQVIDVSPPRGDAPSADISPPKTLSNKPLPRKASQQDFPPVPDLKTERPERGPGQGEGAAPPEYASAREPSTQEILPGAGTPIESATPGDQFRSDPVLSHPVSRTGMEDQLDKLLAIFFKFPRDSLMPLEQGRVWAQIVKDPFSALPLLENFLPDMGKQDVSRNASQSTPVILTSDTLLMNTAVGGIFAEPGLPEKFTLMELYRFFDAMDEQGKLDAAGKMNKFMLQALQSELAPDRDASQGDYLYGFSRQDNSWRGIRFRWRRRKDEQEDTQKQHLDLSIETVTANMGKVILDAMLEPEGADLHFQNERGDVKELLTGEMRKLEKRLDYLDFKVRKWEYSRLQDPEPGRPFPFPRRPGGAVDNDGRLDVKA